MARSRRNRNRRRTRRRRRRQRGAGWRDYLPWNYFSKKKEGEGGGTNKVKKILEK